MKVALFIDGHNFYQALQRVEPQARVDYDKLALYCMIQVSGLAGILAGAYYYASVAASETEVHNKFLDGLEYRPGYFVIREERRYRDWICIHCKRQYQYTIEKRVDVRLAIDMLQLAHANAYDVAILLSGDEDFVPVVDTVRAMGKIVWCATWANELSPSLHQRVYGHINLRLGLDTFRAKIPMTPREAAEWNEE